MVSAALREARVVSLDDYAKCLGGKIPQEVFLPILKQILEGLGYAHERGAIHRDLKPGNILLYGSRFADGDLSDKQTTNRKPQITAKISDFGLVRLVGEEWVRSRAEVSVRQSMSMGDKATLLRQGYGGQADAGTSTRSLLGTYEYMSPEQKRGEEADARSDIYSLGLMTYKLLTGQDLGKKSLTRIDPELVPAWDDLTDEALEQAPGNRMKNCAEFIVRLGVVENQIEEFKQKVAKRAKEEEAARRQCEEEHREEERRRREDEEHRRREETASKAEEARRRTEAERKRLEEAKKETPRPKRGRKAIAAVVLLIAGIGAYMYLSGRGTRDGTVSGTMTVGLGHMRGIRRTA